MKKTLLSLVLTFFTFLTQAQIVNIPDAAFKEILLSMYSGVNTNNNSEIEVAEALTVTELNIYSEYITDLTGLEAFQNLLILKIDEVNVNDLNISTLTNLNELWLGNVSVTNYDFSTLVNLNIFIAYDTELPNLDVSNLTSLTALSVSLCTITNFDISNLSQLKIFNCSENAITSITFPTNNIIESFNCSSNLLNAIDLSSFTQLKTIRCGGNPFSSLTIANNSTLETIYCTDLFLNTIAFQNLPSIKKIDASHGQLTNIDLSQIPSLEDISLSYNSLTSLSLANLPNLMILSCGYNQITNLDLGLIPQLKILGCSNNAITSFDFSASTNLESLACNVNPLTVIDFNGLTNLNNIFFGNVELSQIQNLSALVNLKTFKMGYTTFETIDLSPLEGIRRLEIYNTPLVTLDFSSNSEVIWMALYDNQNLEYVNSNNGRLLASILTGFPEGIRYCPNLTKVCTAERNVNNIRSALTNPNYNNNVIDPLVLPYCNFAPNGDHNTATGTVTFDLDNNGCDANDILVKNAVLNLTSGIIQNETLTNANGVYNFYPAIGNYTLAPILENNYFIVTPSTATVSFADYNNNVSANDFCLTANGIKNNLNIVILPNTVARPGFPTSYSLVYKNTGNQTLSGSINLNFDNSIMTYINSGANNLPNSISPNNLDWNFSNLLPFESRTFYFAMYLNSPLSTPPVNAGDILNFTATVSPLTGDETPADNVFNLTQTVVNSFDPNDKTCLEGNFITPEMVGDYLHYMIRFQNTGTAPAENVVVKDVIDTTKFDMSSLQFTESSHPTYTRILNNAIEFIFEGINLPAEADDEPNSHGFVAFKIKTKNNLVLGNTIENKAEIYFDFNFPIITNTTSTTVSLLGVNDLENNSVSVSPIPVKEMLQIKAKDNITLIELFDIQGRLLQTKSVNNIQTELDFSGKTAGLYLVKIYTYFGVKVQKVIKE